MSFPFDAYLAALTLPGIAVAIVMPLWRQWSWRLRLVDDPGQRKIHGQTMPLAGGPALMTGMIISLVLGAAALQWAGAGTSGAAPLLHGLNRRWPELTVILLGAMGMLLLGLLDDRYELPPLLKFAGQLAIALGVAGAGVRITLFVPSLLFSYAVTALWILAVTNALNFLDNMNGLCTGLGAIGAWCFALGAALQGQYLVTIMGLTVCSACLGFLPFNFPRASSFLGDAGSHLVGYFLAVLAILPHFYSPSHPHVLAVLYPLLVLAVPLGDMAYVVILRWRLGKPFYVGDTNHVSHRLHRAGCSRTLAVLIVWALAALSGALATLLLSPAS
jgi:UDP-GlcNAc:undecaprenyl-phosphate GlcNAc-1-phosphate transferase